VSDIRRFMETCASLRWQKGAVRLQGRGGDDEQTGRATGIERVSESRDQGSNGQAGQIAMGVPAVVVPAGTVRKVLSVTELTWQIKRLLEKQVGEIWVTAR